MTILIDRPITHEFVQQLLNEIKHDTETSLCVVFSNCHGGDVAAGFALMDYCRWQYQNISTMAFGVVASLAAVMFSCMPDKQRDVMGRRCMGKNSVLMFHNMEVGETLPDQDFGDMMAHSMKDELAGVMVQGSFEYLMAALKNKQAEVFYPSQLACDAGLADHVL